MAEHTSKRAGILMRNNGIFDGCFILGMGWIMRFLKGKARSFRGVLCATHTGTLFLLFAPNHWVRGRDGGRVSQVALRPPG